MQFLLDANMPRSAAALLRRLGHEAEDVRDVFPVGLRTKQLHSGHDRSGSYWLVAISILRTFEFV